MSYDSSNVGKSFESESNSNKLESVQEDLNSEGQSTKGQLTINRKSQTVRSDINENIQETQNEYNNEEEENENEKDENLTYNENNNEENENNDKNEKNNDDNLNDNKEEEEKKESKINYAEIYSKLLENYETEKKQYSEKIKQLQIELYSRSENLKKISIRNHFLTNSLQELNVKVDKMIKESSNKKLKIRKYEDKTSPELLLKIKEKELKNSETFLKILQKDNQRIKKLLDLHSGTTSSELLNKIKEKDAENFKLQLEIKNLKRKENSNHSLTERSILKRKIKNLEFEISRTQEDSSRIRTTYENLESLNSISVEAIQRFKDNIKKRNKSHKKISLNVKTPNFYYKVGNNNNITSLKNEIKSFSNEEINIIEKIFDYDSNKIESFLKKISIIEKYKYQFDFENKKILKEQENQVISKKNHINNLDFENNNQDNQLKTLEASLNDYKNSKKILENKLINIQNTIDNIANKINKKETDAIKINEKIKQLQTIILKKEYNTFNQNEINKIIGEDSSTDNKTISSDKK